MAATVGLSKSKRNGTSPGNSRPTAALVQTCHASIARSPVPRSRALPARFRSHRVQSDSPAASPDDLAARGTLYFRLSDIFLSLPSGTAVLRGCQTDPVRTAQPSLPAAVDNLAPIPRPPGKSPPPHRSAPAAAHRPECRPACLRSAARSSLLLPRSATPTSNRSCPLWARTNRRLALLPPPRITASLIHSPTPLQPNSPCARSPAAAPSAAPPASPTAPYLSTSPARPRPDPPAAGCFPQL